MTTTRSVSEARECGHDGRCDKCRKPITWMLAEKVPPECSCGGCVDGDAALAFYCGGCVAGPAVATRDDVARNAQRRPSQLWSVALDSWPRPVALVDDPAQAPVRGC